MFEHDAKIRPDYDEKLFVSKSLWLYDMSLSITTDILSMSLNIDNNILMLLNVNALNVKFIFCIINNTRVKVLSLRDLEFEKLAMLK